MGDVEKQTNHSNIANVVLRRIKKYCSKKAKSSTEGKKQKYKAYFEGEKGIFIIEKLTCDLIERCKLPEAIELRKKLGYNHNNIIVCEETSIAEKTIKLFPHENIVLNKKFNGRKPDIWFKKAKNVTIEVDEGNHADFDKEDEEERKEMFNKYKMENFHCNPNDPNFDLYKFLGKINACNTKLCKKEAVNLINDKLLTIFK